MGKSRNYDKELSKYDHFKHENDKLKREVKSLRKQLDRLQNRYNGLDEMVEDQEIVQETKPTQEQLMREWGCNICGKDYLRIFRIHRLDGEFYFRRCLTCANKTRLKRYTKDVKGVVEND